MWFGIILFGMSNGFLLLPVILSFVGTVHDKELLEKRASSKEVTDTISRESSELDVDVTPVKENEEQSDGEQTARQNQIIDS